MIAQTKAATEQEEKKSVRVSEKRQQSNSQDNFYSDVVVLISNPPVGESVGESDVEEVETKTTKKKPGQKKKFATKPFWPGTNPNFRTAEPADTPARRERLISAATLSWNEASRALTTELFTDWEAVTGFLSFQVAATTARDRIAKLRGMAGFLAKTNSKEKTVSGLFFRSIERIMLLISHIDATWENESTRAGYFSCLAVIAEAIANRIVPATNDCLPNASAAKILATKASKKAGINRNAIRAVKKSKLEAAKKGVLISWADWHALHDDNVLNQREFLRQFPDPSQLNGEQTRLFFQRYLFQVLILNILPLIALLLFCIS